MNQVQLIGRMARDPELRRTEKGTPVVSFALAVDRRFQRDTVDFIDCVAWRSPAEFVDKYFRKGKRVALTGSIQVRKWKDKDGNDRMQEEIQANYNRVKQEVQQIVTDEMERIKNDPNLQHLIKTEE